jgi:signal transduction histidine kinase
MSDSYQVPVFFLTTLLLPAFGYLYMRFRDTRTLLWFLGFFFAIIRMFFFYDFGLWNFSDGFHPWLTTIGQTSIQISSALFLASLSPQSFRIGRFKVLYVIPFFAPVAIYTILFDCVFQGVSPQGPLFLIFPVLALIVLVVGFFWSIEKGNLPIWQGVASCLFFGSLGFWICFTRGAAWLFPFVECVNHFMTALLLVYVFRRFSLGVALSALGFMAWSLTFLRVFPSIASNVWLYLALKRITAMGTVVAAIGMILLVLEDEFAKNAAARKRERRARLELEAYTNLILSLRRIEDIDRQGAGICEAVATHSRFTKVALLLLDGSGRYRLAGAAGLDTATAIALGVLAARIPIANFMTPGSAPPAVAHSQTLSIDLVPWLVPGDDLKRLRFTSALAVPMTGRSDTEGALLLAGMRNPSQPLRADDLYPVELLMTRLQAVRSQTMMLEKLIDSEKLAGLGQLAGNVSQQLNNPLTVILGYASLLEGTSSLDSKDRKGVESILTEARHMRSTLESLSRISRHHNDQLAAVSVTELLTDMEEVYRSELTRREIEFRLSIAPELPRVLCHTQQLRQAVLHCLQFAIEAVEKQDPTHGEAKAIRLEATSKENMVQIQIAHSGPGFPDPEHAFDPVLPAQATKETASLGLNLCATIIRNHNGRASAVNLEPYGAAIFLELQSA